MANQKNLSSLTYGELPERVQKLLPQPHIWDNKNISEQRDWAIEALEAAEAKLGKMRKALDKLIRSRRETEATDRLGLVYVTDDWSEIWAALAE